jgi:hypothetical protein
VDTLLGVDKLGTDQEATKLLCNLKVRCLIDTQESAIKPFLEPFQSIHSFTPCFFQIDINVTSPSMDSLPSGIIYSGFPTKILNAFYLTLMGI